MVGEGDGAGPRLKSLARAVVYAGFAVLTFKAISGAQSGSQSRQQQDLTAKVMQHPAGQWLVAIAGVIAVIVGLVLIAEGWRRKFMKYLETGRMRARTRRIVRLLGTVGTIARGVVFALAGATASPHPAGPATRRPSPRPACTPRR